MENDTILAAPSANEAAKSLHTHYEDGYNSESGKQVREIFSAVGLAHLLGAETATRSLLLDEYKDEPLARFAFGELTKMLEKDTTPVEENGDEDLKLLTALNPENDKRVHVYTAIFAPSNHIVDIFQSENLGFALILNTDTTDGSIQAIAFGANDEEVIVLDLQHAHRPGELYAASLLQTPHDEATLLADAILARLQSELNDGMGQESHDFECYRYLGV